MSNDINKEDYDFENDKDIDFSSEGALDSGKEIESKEEVISEQESTQDPQEEVKAKKWGHQSKDEWIAAGKDPAKWKSPKEYNQYGDAYQLIRDDIKALREQNSRKDREISLLIEYHKQSAEQAVKQAKAELEAQLKHAKDYGDVESVQRLTEQKYKMEAQQEHQEQITDREKVARVDREFLSRNAHWFNSQNPQLMEEANTISLRLKKAYPDYEELVKETEDVMKTKYPHLFAAPQIRGPQISPTQSNVNKSSMQSSHDPEEVSWNKLSAQQKAEYNAVKDLLPPTIKYTIKEFLQRTKGE